MYPLVDGWLVGSWCRAVMLPIDPRPSPACRMRASRITLYPVAPLGVRNQNPSCTGEGAGAPRGWDLSEEAASCSQGEERSHIHLGSLGVIAVAPAPVVGFLPSNLEDGASGHQPGLQIAPQRHQQLARQGHDHDPLEAALGAVHARAEADLRMIRLKAHLRDQCLGQRIPGVAEAVCDGEVIVARRRYVLRLDPVQPETGRVFE